MAEPMSRRRVESALTRASSDHAVRFRSTADLQRRLEDVGYLASEHVAGVVALADQLNKPVLVEGPAGTGKTELAKSVAKLLGIRLIRLQCYEGLDESRALYEWNYRKQLLRLQHDWRDDSSSSTQTWDQVESDIFSSDFLLTRPLLEAILADDPVVLLVDEVDRLEMETEALLLEVLAEFQVSIPELGTLQARQFPLVFLTSNSSRDLSEPLKRRCLYLHIDYPSPEREREIIKAKVPGVSEDLARQVSELVSALRKMDLKKAPSVSETLDWARTLVLASVDQLDPALVTSTLHVLLKYQRDIDSAGAQLGSHSGWPLPDRPH